MTRHTDDCNIHYGNLCNCKAVPELTPEERRIVEWLRAISTWLLETDNDMKLPSGILDVDPLDLADALEHRKAPQ